MNNLFNELLQVSLGSREKLSRVPNEREWETLFEEALNQAIAGILLCGIERLSEEQRPPLQTLYEWIGEMQFIEAANKHTTKACKRLCEELERDGFRPCVLKGQANHRYYPEAMGRRRSCGDVDLWVYPKDNGKRNYVRRTLEYVESKHELTGLCWLHCNFDDESGVPVEVHFRPSFMNDPVHNRRFQNFFDDFESCVGKKEIDGAMIPALRVEKDVIFQMSHIYRHLIDEGVGLRQIVDYYYVLRAAQHKGLQHDSILEEINRLGMKRFAKALMYVLKEVCGMGREYLLCEPNEKDGKLLVNEIMIAGNFGQADPRMGALNTKNVLHRRLSQAWRRFKRNMRFLTSYPGEVIWEPVARMKHFAWKQLKLWKY